MSLNQHQNLDLIVITMPSLSVCTLLMCRKKYSRVMRAELSKKWYKILNNQYSIITFLITTQKLFQIMR